MRRFFRELIQIGLLLLILLSAIVIARRSIVRNHSWDINGKVHTLFLGASHITHAVDDSMMETAINWSRASERYMYTYIKLCHLLPSNPQIDTVFLELAPTDLWIDTDYKYHDVVEQSGYIKLFWPFLEKEHWLVFKKEPFQVLGLVRESFSDFDDLKQADWWVHMGGYREKDGKMNAQEVIPQQEVDSHHGHDVNYDYLRRIINLCGDYGVKLFFLETPTFHPEFFYDIDYYHHIYQELFSDVEFVDYSDWPMEDSERADPHHLNAVGAKRFTQELMDRFNVR